jgi:hypothetical protein
MEKLSGVKVSAEWARALVACVDEVPVRSRDSRRAWVWGVVLVLSMVAGAAGVAVWFGW